jgi:hypothetical protein
MLCAHQSLANEGSLGHLLADLNNSGWSTAGDHAENSRQGRIDQKRGEVRQVVVRVQLMARPNNKNDRLRKSQGGDKCSDDLSQSSLSPMKHHTLMGQGLKYRFGIEMVLTERTVQDPMIGEVGVRRKLPILQTLHRSQLEWYRTLDVVSNSRQVYET